MAYTFDGHGMGHGLMGSLNVKEIEDIDGWVTLKV